ncbi:glycosyltransferase family 4 protein [Cellulophaga sp. HaHaR_3_176]|uniref:glycosyltransferase family 4 protein n=1 Tax=Cellulophaga sp. HaHaR_3_176 TaxID=1942464 RepID=UPI001C1FC5F2|nr:glycosyltransferase family 1 protein [Cellulophaga sp. HaHaR_3_176]QWX82709.1 glycosyltransferase family 4 protein [Cellulophaga sp. HaHaR_3_176]
MKIGFEAKRVYHNTTGLGNYGRDLIRSLANFYPENQYFLYNPKKRQEALFTSEAQNVFEKLPSSKFYKKFKNYWRQKAVVNDLIKDKIELYHGLSGELPSGLSKNNIKSVVTIHDLIFVHHPNLYSFFDRKIHFLKFKKAAENADIVIAISEQTKRDIVQYLKIESKKVKVIYQTCHDAFKITYADQEKEDVRIKHNLPSNFLLNVGTLEERKNALTIVKAIKNIDTKLVLIGRETTYSNTIKSYIKEHKLEDKIIFLKNINIKELAIIYQLATIFIYPSIFEGFGIPIIEALYSKTPVITSNSGVFPEAGGPDSLYIDPYDSDDLKEKIQMLLVDQNLRNSISEKSFKFVQKFSADQIVEEVNNVYKSIL